MVVDLLYTYTDTLWLWEDATLGRYPSLELPCFANVARVYSRQRQLGIESDWSILGVSFPYDREPRMYVIALAFSGLIERTFSRVEPLLCLFSERHRAKTHRQGSSDSCTEE